MADGTPSLLEVRNLRKHFPVRKGVLARVTAYVKAVDDVSFSIKSGETFGLVGESGCGKTTAGRAVLRLIEPDSGEIRFDGVELLKLLSKGASEFRLLHSLVIRQLVLAKFEYLQVIEEKWRRADKQHRAKNQPKNAHASDGYTVEERIEVEGHAVRIL